MYYSATDIASFRTLRETILIGPRAAFGVHVSDLQARGATELRAIVDRLVIHHGRGPELRASLARWGLDPAVATRRERAYLPAWLVNQAVRGAIAIVVVPDPTLAYSGFADDEERIIANVRRAILPRRMTMSSIGRRVLVAQEGIVLRRHLGPDGVWRIGIGHRGRDGSPDPEFETGAIDVKQALRFFRRDLPRYEREVTATLSIGVEQHEYDALVSFHFATGAFARSDIARRLNNGDRAGAAAAFMTTPGHATERRRRQAEMLLFRDGTYPRTAARIYEVTLDERIDRHRGELFDLTPHLGFSESEGWRVGLPPTLEERFVIALTQVPGHLDGDVRETYVGLLRSVGLGKIASSLLVWNADFIASALRMDLGLLAYDQASMSSEVVRATRALTGVLREIEEIQSRSQLPDVVDELADAISVLIVNHLFDRLLSTMKIAKGHAVHQDAGTSKPSLPKVAPRQPRAPAPPEPKAAAVLAPKPAEHAVKGSSTPQGSTPPDEVKTNAASSEFAARFEKITGMSLDESLHLYKANTSKSLDGATVEKLFGDAAAAKKILMDDEDIHRHYRDILNSNIPQTLKEAEDLGYTEPQFLGSTHLGAFYHDPWNNRKFVSPDGHREAVYDKKTGKLVTSLKDKGTFNFFGPDQTSAHKAADVDPYRKWGN